MQTPIRHYHVGIASFSDERLAAMRTLVATTLREESRSLSTLVRREVSFELTDIAAGPPDGDQAFAYDVRSAEHHVVGQLIFGAPAVVAIADLMMGGLGAADDRAPTGLEAEIASGRLTNLSASLVGIVQGPCGTVTLDPVGDDSLLLGDLVTVRFEVVTTEGRHAMAFAAPVRRPVSASEDLDLVARTCADVPIEVRLQFRPVQLAATDVASLAVGDVLCLDHEVNDPIVGTVDGKPLLRTRPGRTRRRVAVQILEILDDEEFDPPHGDAAGTDPDRSRHGDPVVLAAGETAR